MTTKQVQEGSVIDYTAGGAVAAGAVVEMKHTVGVALKAAAASGDVIAVSIDGVFELPAVVASAILIGEKLIWDTSAGKFDNSAATPATGDITGAAVAVRAKAATTESTVWAKLTPGNATLT